MQQERRAQELSADGVARANVPPRTCTRAPTPQPQPKPNRHRRVERQLYSNNPEPLSTNGNTLLMTSAHLKNTELKIVLRQGRGTLSYIGARNFLPHSFLTLSM